MSEGRSDLPWWSRAFLFRSGRHFGRRDLELPENGRYERSIQVAPSLCAGGWIHKQEGATNVGQGAFVVPSYPGYSNC
jgi:hypothetical protein